MLFLIALSLNCNNCLKEYNLCLLDSIGYTHKEKLTQIEMFKRQKNCKEKVNKCSKLNKCEK